MGLTYVIQTSTFEQVHNHINLKHFHLVLGREPKWEKVPAWLFFSNIALVHIKVGEPIFFSSLVVRVNLLQLYPILVPLWLMNIFLVFLCPSKLSFSSFLQFNGNFVLRQNYATYRTNAPLNDHLS